MMDNKELDLDEYFNLWFQLNLYIYSQDNQESESLEHLLATLQQQQTIQPPDPPQLQKKRNAESRFTAQEDKQILKLVFQVGPNFNKIVKYFPGKTMNMVKNRYYKKLRYLKDDIQSDDDDPKRKQKKQQ
ncbi:hypothetical protein pb186bvf_010771 [Paramecium bursaria]